MNPRDRNGRVCGCDRGENYLCVGHRMALDAKTWRAGDLGIRGPFYDTCIVLEIAGSIARLDRWQAEDLVEELQRRLALRAE